MLTALVGLGVVLLVVVRPPARRGGLFAVRGHRLFSLPRAAVRALDVELDGRRFVARPLAGGWELDGRPAAPGASAALGDLLDTLLELRAVDAFRRAEGVSFGLDRPRGVIELVTARRRKRLVLGGLNAAGSALYGRRGRDPRVFLVGSLLLSEIQRVFYQRDSVARSAAREGPSD